MHAYYLSFSAFLSTVFFFGIYLPFQRTLWLSLILAGLILWAILTAALGQCSAPVKRLHPAPGLFRRLFAPVSIIYGGLMLYAFWCFCRQCIFRKPQLLFFALFLIMAFWGACLGLETLERTAKFTSVIVMALLGLTVISTLQKLWSQKDFVLQTAPDLLRFSSSSPAALPWNIPLGSFLPQTVFVILLLLVQALTIFIAADHQPCTPLLKSMRRTVLPATLSAALLYLLAALALGSNSFEFLTYPVYDMLSLPGYAEYLDRTEFLMLVLYFFCECCKIICAITAGRRLFSRTEAQQ